MKLRAKFQDEYFDLGEVVDADIATMPDGGIKFQIAARDGGPRKRLPIIFYGKLEKLYSQWEDVQPKVGYIVDPMEEDCVSTEDNSGYEDSDIERAKELGIWFETEEEAKKAVEKLKAFNRLEDKQFKFYGWDKGSLLKSKPNTIEFACDDTRSWSWEDIRNDLDICFGGEE